jgi:hypothetical protein
MGTTHDKALDTAKAGGRNRIVKAEDNIHDGRSDSMEDENGRSVVRTRFLLERWLANMYVIDFSR